jgi:hypothetical protein
MDLAETGIGIVLLIGAHAIVKPLKRLSEFGLTIGMGLRHGGVRFDAADGRGLCICMARWDRFLNRNVRVAQGLGKCTLLCFLIFW